MGAFYQNQNVRCRVVHLLYIPFAANVPIGWSKPLKCMETALRCQIPNLRLFVAFVGFR